MRRLATEAEVLTHAPCAVHVSQWNDYGVVEAATLAPHTAEAASKPGVPIGAHGQRVAVVALEVGDTASR